MKSKDDWERRIMLKMARRSRVFTVGGYVIMFASIIALSLGPVFGMPMQGMNNITNPDERALPFQSYYPYDYWKSPNFELLYLVQVVAAVFIGVTFTSTANFFVVLVFLTCGQVKIIGRKIENLQFPSVITKSSNLSEATKRVGHTFGQIVDAHVSVIG